tara:strand:- start:43758 stop:43931 length:174 start_codon:yes stop_codon:yes gene_type:complete
MPLSENEIKNQIAIGETYAESMEWWDGEPELQYHNGYIHALEYVLGKSKARYSKEDI